MSPTRRRQWDSDSISSGLVSSVFKGSQGSRAAGLGQNDCDQRDRVISSYFGYVAPNHWLRDCPRHREALIAPQRTKLAPKLGGQGQGSRSWPS